MNRNSRGTVTCGLAVTGLLTAVGCSGADTGVALVRYTKPLLAAVPGEGYPATAVEARAAALSP
ncbi:hypothetical protein [Streptomyces sp. NPDC008137]|uniref:hypothetical protein n=1 Tax=Streptomyces sp. NPDC008137 TaxID=3364813 RepID=UPI0036EEB71F